MLSREIEIAVAFLLDMLLGDPPSLPHPVVVMGGAIRKGEAWLRRFIPWERLAGAVLALSLVGGTYLFGWGLLRIAGQVHPLLEDGLSIYLIYTCLSLRGLIQETQDVQSALKEGDLGRARTELAQIVGRDTQDLPESEVVRGAVESAAENSVDGFLSPVFFAFLGGAPLALSYKAVNTLDSMVGYKNERYLHFGWASARLDDLANWIPARLAGLLIPLASGLCGLRGRDSWRIRRRDGHLHPSPNSGISEAAMAGALGVQLGGESHYQGRPSRKPLLGDPLKVPEGEDILRSLRLLKATSLLALILGFFISSVAKLTFFN